MIGGSKQMDFGIRITADGRVMVTEAGKAEAALANIGKAAGDVNRNVKQLSGTIGEMGHATVAILAVREAMQGLAAVGRIVDSFTEVQSRLALVSRGAADLARTQQALFATAQETRTEFGDLATVYTRLAKAGGEIGISHDRMLEVTKTLSQAMTIGGGSAESMRAALVQLSQGLASGTLRGEELNSILEQAPRLAQALADGMGVSIGQLRKLGEEGRITAKAIVEALEKTAPGIAQEFQSITPTISQAFTTWRNAAGLFISELDKGSGTSATFARALTDMAKALGDAARNAQELGRSVGPLVEIGATTAGITAAGAAIAYLAGKLLELRKLIANPFVITVAIVTAGKNAVDAFRESEAGLRARISTEEVNLKGLERSLSAERITRPGSAELAQLESRVVKSRADIAQMKGELRGLEVARRSADPLAQALKSMRETDRAWEKEQTQARERVFERFLQEYASDADKALAAKNKVLSAFAEAVSGMPHESAQYQQALKALRAELADIDKKAAGRQRKPKRETFEPTVRGDLITTPEGDFATEFEARYQEALARRKQIQDLFSQTPMGREYQAAQMTALIDDWERFGEVSADVAQQMRETVNGFDDIKTSGKEAFAELAAAIDGWGKDSAKAITDFAFGAKGSFSDMVQSMLRDLSQLVVYEGFTRPAAAAIKGSSLFSALTSFLPFHTGGIVGAESGGAPRLLPTALLPPAPRFHGGLMPGEFPAVLKEGEGVFTPAQMRALGGSTYNVAIHVDAAGNARVQAPGAAQDLARRMEAAVKQVLVAERRPGGMLAGA